MKKKWCIKMISMLLVIATFLGSLPLTVFAEEAQQTAEVYVRSIKLVQAKTKKEAKEILEGDGCIFLDHNLNEGSDNDGIWLGYTTTTDPTKAIYDIKLMNAKGGYTLTSMKEALEAQKASFDQMAKELNYLVEEFAEAYRADSIPAQKAYMALNFFRVVDGETEYPEENGLGYHLVHGKISIDKLTEMLLFCDATIFDSIVKLLTVGIQLRTGNWLEKLSKLGPYDSTKTYGANETELKQRAKQLLTVFQLYAQSYKAMDAVGLFRGMDENKQGAKQEGSELTQNKATAEQQDIAAVDMARAAIYKVLFDDLAKYTYGTKTLKDFFLSLETGGSEKALYPLVSILTDGEFAALSYGCVLEMVSGAGAKVSDFAVYDDRFSEVTKGSQPIYIYMGVNPALLKDDTVVGFTDEASRNMALTGEYQFYEKESKGKEIWENGRNVAMGIQFIGACMMGVSQSVLFLASATGTLASLTATSATGILAGIVKTCAVIGGPYFTIIITAAALVVAVYAYIRYVIDEYKNSHLDWDKYPIPEYICDAKEVGFISTSQNDGIAAEYIKKTSYVFYEVVRSVSKKPMDLNAFSSDAAQWIAMYVSYDRPGDNAKPIKASDFKVKTGNGETPDGYTPVSRFGEVRAYNLNQWDARDRVNGVFMFYQQDKMISVKSDRTYYISNVMLQTGESDAHCISLLEAADYIPLNVNLSPDYIEDGIPARKRVYTYLGFKLTDNPTEAIRDIRIEYGDPQATVQYGGITYAACGSSAGVTLYATRYKEAGTPILAGGLICVNNRDDAPAGYEPVNFFAGGPAAPLNLTKNGIEIHTKETYLYFLPETTFVNGETYLGGLSYFYCSPSALSKRVFTDLYGSSQILTYLKEKTGKDYPVDTNDEIKQALTDYAFLKFGYHGFATTDVTSSDSVLYYATHNPYRAIYDIRGTKSGEFQNSFVFDSIGYSVWNTTWWSGGLYSTGTMLNYEFYLRYNNQGKGDHLSSDGKIFVSGNISKENIYDAKSNMMTDIQPLKMSEFICLLEGNNTHSAVSGENSPYHAVSDTFDNSHAALSVKSNKGTNKFNFYITKNIEEKPYISAITFADKLTLYRGLGGADAGLKRNTITDDMLFAQLAGQGATYFSALTTSMYGCSIQDVTKMNAMKIGYTRTADVDQALTDVFIYFGGFSIDKAPREIYRGEVQYKVLCEIPYNLTGYEGAPRPVLCLYGTTDSRAGSPITDVDFTDTPFKDGYRAVRTQNGRSVWSEIIDYVGKQQSSHFMSGAKTLFKRLLAFFSFDYQDGEIGYASSGYFANYHNSKQYFYIQIKQEEEVKKPYISNLYLQNKTFHFEGSYASTASEPLRKALLDNLFDQGAEEIVDVDLNFGADDPRSQIYLGYSRTADPNDAITSIRPAHDGGAQQTRNPNGVLYHLVSNVNLNHKMGGDAIYLYYTKSQDPDIGSPISDIIPTYKTAPSYYTIDSAQVLPAMRWDSWKPSDLNAGTGKTAIYLSVVRPFETPYGSDIVLDYGKQATSTRKTSAGKAQGKYIAALYVMDKNTIRQEKLAKGIPSNQCTCDKITDQEVFDRLTAMGATTIIKIPINITGGEYGKNNSNKVFIGYSRTDNVDSAIKHIAIQTDVLTLSEPPEIQTIKGTSYDLVAENARRVTTLPRAINLLATQDGQDLLIPRMYLYTSKEGDTEPIYDISIDKTPLREGWVTVRSENGINPFSDIYEEALKHAELGDKDDSDSHDDEIVYTDELYKWMQSVANMFNPREDQVSPFFIHFKKYEGNSIENTLPYIEKIYIAYGDSQNEALAKLIEFEPDGFVDYDLNKKAGYPYIYLAYKRTASRSDAIKELAVFTGKNPSDSKSIHVASGANARFDLVSDVDLNKGVGGSYLYLYATTNSAAGEPIRSLRASSGVVSTEKNGVTESTVRIAENSQFTKDAADLNKGVGFWSSYIYLIAKRHTSANNAGTLFNSGAWIAIGVFAGVAIAYAGFVCIKKKKRVHASDENADL